MNGSGTKQAPGTERRHELDRERDTPQDVAPRGRREDRRGPDERCRSERQEERPRESPCLGDVSARARVQGEQHEPDADVRDRKSDRRALEDARHRRRQDRDAEHGEQRQQPVHEVVRVEAVRVEGEARPRPPDGDEDGHELEEACGSRLGGKRVRELPDRRDEDKVEEELEPRRPPVLGVGAHDRPEPGRLEQARQGSHGGRAPSAPAEIRTALLRERRQALARVL